MINPRPGMKIVRCDVCLGTGVVMHYPMRGSNVSMKAYPVECSECLGEGTVEIEDEDYSDE